MTDIRKYDKYKSYADYIVEYGKAQNAASGSKFDANANVESKNVATLSGEIFKGEEIGTNRYRMIQKIAEMYGEDMARSYINDLERHVIYRCDETHATLPYCVSITMYPFILDGLASIGGTKGEPKHLSSFCGQFINLVFAVAAQFAGAVATPEFLVYLDHFIRLEYGDDYYLHTDEVTNARSSRPRTIFKEITDCFEQIVYTLNAPAAARNYQAVFWNVAYYDRPYFDAIFGEFVFPDGDEPKYESLAWLQENFMEWLRNTRVTKEWLTFPVETANAVYDKATKEYYDYDFVKMCCKLWSRGHSFFFYNNDSADSLSSCCFSKDQMVLARSTSRGETKVWYTTFENLGKTNDGPDRTQFQIFHNGNWVNGRKIVLNNEKMFKVTTANNKEIVVSYNHLNPTTRGDIATENLTTDDYLMFNNRVLEAVPEQDSHLTYEQGFVVGMFLGDGSFGSAMPLASGDEKIFDVNFSLNSDKYAECVEKINTANRQLGDDGVCSLSQTYNNVYPARISSETLVNFIIKWTNWERGTYSFNKELNMECMLQSSEFRKGILDGWYATDGGNSNRCYTTSKKLVDCMELLITSIGLNSIVNISDRRGEETYIRGELVNHNYPLYCVRWYSPKTKRKMDGVYKIINNSTYFKIKSIEPIEYDDKIYCFEIDNEEEPYFTLPNGIITHNCRLKNGITSNVFSYTLGAGGISTGSKAVITMNINRIVQNAVRDGKDISDAIREQIRKNHKYLLAFNEILKEEKKAGLLPIYDAGYISLEKQYLTTGLLGYTEAAEFLGIDISTNEKYYDFLEKILAPAAEENRKAKTSEVMFNCEAVPGENMAVKFAAWDKKDGYFVPRDCYNSYFFRADDDTISVLDKMKLHGDRVIKHLDGGSACHINLAEHLSEEQYMTLAKAAARFGCSYYTYNIPNTICNECGHIDKHYLEKCPCCGTTNVDYITRIIGYAKRISKWSEQRQKEAQTRFYDGETKTEISE